VRVIRTYVDTGRVLNVVNLSRQTFATHVMVVRHLDKPGVLADVFATLGREGVNVQETENVVFAGAEAALARMNLDREPSEAVLANLRATNAAILDIILVPLNAPASSHHIARTLTVQQ